MPDTSDSTYSMGEIAKAAGSVENYIASAAVSAALTTAIEATTANKTMATTAAGPAASTSPTTSVTRCGVTGQVAAALAPAFSSQPKQQSTSHEEAYIDTEEGASGGTAVVDTDKGGGYHDEIRAHEEYPALSENEDEGGTLVLVANGEMSPGEMSLPKTLASLPENTYADSVTAGVKNEGAALTVPDDEESDGRRQQSPTMPAVATTTALRDDISLPHGGEDETGETAMVDEDKEESRRVVYIGGAKEGSTVWFKGRRQAAFVQVVEQCHPFYQLEISVEVTLVGGQQTEEENTWKAGEPVGSLGATKGNEETAEVPKASISLRKSQIKDLVVRWIGSIPSGGSADAVSTSSPWATGATGGARTDAALRSWMSGGRAPRRAQLLQWLLWRVEVVDVENSGGLRWRPAGSNKMRTAGKKWSLEIAHVHGSNDVARICARNGNQTEEPANEGVVQERDNDAQRMEGKGSRDDTQQDATHTQDRQHSSSDGQEAPEWWGRGSTATQSSTASSDVLVVRPAQATLPPYDESIGIPFTPAPPTYQDVVRVSRQDRQNDADDHANAAQRSNPPAYVSPKSADDSYPTPSYHGGESRGAPPSYHTPSSHSIRSSSTSSTSSGSIHRRRRSCRSKSNRCDIPPPVSTQIATTHGDYTPSTTAARDARHRQHLRGRSDQENKSIRDHDRDHDLEREHERERERERERRRRRQVSENGGRTMATTWMDSRPETTGSYNRRNSNHHHHSTSTWGYERARTERWNGTGTASVTTGRLPPTPTTAPTGREIARGDATSGSRLGGTECWDDDRWRLTGYLNSCKKELTQAENRRRRAEAAAMAAERMAGNKTRRGRAAERTQRAWTRAATQRVLDLTLVAERVRQEEQKQRVACTRANEKIARRKQPFGEKRGRTQKGPSMGPPVPRTEPVEPPRHPRVESALRKFYWDEHGRRFQREGGGEGADNDSAPGEVEVAMAAVRRVAAACLEEGIDFRQPFLALDSDGDGRLTLAELGAALRRAGVLLSLSQVTALFRHFDLEGSDSVNRREFLWAFVDRRSLLAQWRKARGQRGGSRGRTAPFRDRADDPGAETLSRLNFVRALAEVPLIVEGWEQGALLDRFQDVHDDGENINWREFVSFMRASEEHADEDVRYNDEDAAATDHLGYYNDIDDHKNNKNARRRENNTKKRENSTLLPPYQFESSKRGAISNVGYSNQGVDGYEDVGGGGDGGRRSVTTDVDIVQDDHRRSRRRMPLIRHHSVINNKHHRHDHHRGDTKHEPVTVETSVRKNANTSFHHHHHNHHRHNGGLFDLETDGNRRGNTSAGRRTIPWDVMATLDSDVSQQQRHPRASTASGIVDNAGGLRQETRVGRSRVLPRAVSAGEGGGRHGGTTMHTGLREGGGEERGRGGTGGGITDGAAALKVLDQLLDDQRDLEAFLEEEFARRE